MYPRALIRCCLFFTLVRIFFIDNCSFHSIPNPDADGGITWTSGKETVSGHGDFRPADTGDQIEVSIEHLCGLGHVGVLHAKALIPITSGDDETIVAGDNETLMTLLKTFVEAITQMSAM